MLLKRVHVIVATAFTALAISATGAFADDDRGDGQRGYGHHTDKKYHQHGRKISVDCDDGETLTEALEIAKPGTTIRFEGTCTELVTIKTDSLTLDGGGTAIIDGGGGGPEAISVITIDGARNVTITGLIVQNSPGAGIWGQRASMFTVRNAVMQNNALTGIAVVENSAAEITDSSVTGGSSGIVASGSSNAILSGEVSANSTGYYGIAAFDKSSIEFRAVAVSSNNHGFFGMLSLDSIFIVPGIAGQEQTVIEANNNGLDGIRLGDHGTLRSMGAAKISVSENGSSGIWVGNQSTIGTPPSPNIEMIFENNPVGMYFDVGSGAAIDGGELTVTGNDIGLLGDGTDLNINYANVTGNTSDVKLSLGTRAVFNNVSFGSIDCDDTVVSRGACP